jgi:hypothetical protein
MPATASTKAIPARIASSSMLNRRSAVDLSITSSIERMAVGGKSLSIDEST